MSKEKVGLGSWEELDEETRDKLVEREIWKQENYDAWIEEREQEELKEVKKIKSAIKKRKGKNRKFQDEDEDENDGEYID
jgi:hypothetical protein